MHLPKPKRMPNAPLMLRCSLLFLFTWIIPISHQTVTPTPHFLVCYQYHMHIHWVSCSIQKLIVFPRVNIAFPNSKYALILKLLNCIIINHIHDTLNSLTFKFIQCPSKRKTNNTLLSCALIRSLPIFSPLTEVTPWQIFYDRLLR